ncbi:hypothetical protein M9458_007587, partial [Cirrhinus mrigala]
VIPLSAVIPVFGVMIWCVWMAYTILEDPVCHELPPRLMLPPPLLCPPSSSVPLLLHPASPSSSSTLYLYIEVRGSQVSASNLQDPDSPLGHRPIGSNIANSSPSFAVTHQSTVSTGLPRLSGSALVGRRPALDSGLHSSSFVLSLCPSGTVGLLAPSGSTL